MGSTKTVLKPSSRRAPRISSTEGWGDGLGRGQDGLREAVSWHPSTAGRWSGRHACSQVG